MGVHRPNYDGLRGISILELKRNKMFEVDLVDGKRGEKLVARLFESRGLTVEFPVDGYFPDYDFLIKGTPPKYIEVKTDFLSCVTGNLALEHKAIQKSKATHFVYLVVKPYLIRSEDLRWLCDSPDYKQVMGGDFEDILTLIPIKGEGFKKFNEI